MKYWLETRYPGVTKNLLRRLYFHRDPRKMRIARRMSVGDRVLEYETGVHPDTKERGSKTIIAMGVVAGDIQYLPRSKARRAGERWPDVVRAFDLRAHIPLDRKHLGVPLRRIREVLGWEPKAPIYRTMEIKSEEHYRVLESELLKRIELAKIGDAESDEAAEDAVGKLAQKRGQSPEDVAAELLSLIRTGTRPQTPRRTRISGFEYKTDRALSAALKQLYRWRCQICGYTFAKRDGSLYCETHHITALSDGGLDMLDNMLVLCPTCHSEMHLAKVWGAGAILRHKAIQINGRRYPVRVHPEHVRALH